MPRHLFTGYSRSPHLKTSEVSNSTFVGNVLAAVAIIQSPKVVAGCLRNAVNPFTPDMLHPSQQQENCFRFIPPTTPGRRKTGKVGKHTFIDFSAWNGEKATLLTHIEYFESLAKFSAHLHKRKFSI